MKCRLLVSYDSDGNSAALVWKGLGIDGLREDYGLADFNEQFCLSQDDELYGFPGLYVIEGNVEFTYGGMYNEEPIGWEWHGRDEWRRPNEKELNILLRYELARIEDLWEDIQSSDEYWQEYSEKRDKGSRDAISISLDDVGNLDEVLGL